MTELALATTTELINELSKRMNQFVIVSNFLDENRVPRTMLFTGQTTDQVSTLGLLRWGTIAADMNAVRALSPGTTGLYGA
jgi:hypothetical protein